MKKVVTTLGTVALLLVIAYIVYQWAFDWKAPSAKDTIRGQIVEVIGEANVLASKARQKVDDFNKMVGELGRAAARTGYHVQVLTDKEVKARHAVELVASELRFIQTALQKNEPLRYVDGSTLSSEEIELRVTALGESLGASRELLQAIVNEKTYYEKLHQEKMKNLRLAPSHRQLLQVRLASLEQQRKFYEEQKARLDQNLMAGEDAYTNLLNEAKAAINEAKAVITPAVTNIDTATNGFRELMKNGSDAKLDSSNAATDRTLEKLDTLLAPGK